MRRRGAEQLLLLQRSAAAVPLDISNAAQFDALPASFALVLFYRDSDADDQNPTVFDPDVDETLIELHGDPYMELSANFLVEYEACVTRAQYECRRHPLQQEVLAVARSDLSGFELDALIVLVYKRDSAATSVSKNRLSAPFRNTANGMRDNAPSPELTLFRQHSFEPYVRCRIVWHREPKLNSTIGTIIIEVTERL